MALTLAALVLFVASVNAVSLGQDKCSWGPSYWCHKYKQAVECDAVEHCRTKVWTLKNDEACDMCKTLVPLAKDYLSKNSTQTEVVTMLEEACEEFGGQYADICKTLVQQYEPEIMKMLLDMMSDPNQVCTELGLCSSKVSNKVDAELIMSAMPLKKHLKTILAPGLLIAAKPAIVKPKPYKASAQCILCEFVMSKLDNILKENATQQEIEDALEKVCSYLPSSISAECDAFIAQYAPAILAILSQELNPKIVCTALGLCASEEHHKATQKPVKLLPGSNETCEICETVMTYLKNLLADNATEQEILQLLEQVCNYLPAQIASECNAIVSEYGPAILKLIAESDPHTLCEEIGLCSSALKKKPDDFCFLGASYWCANKQNAANCNALQHCTDHVWN